MALAVMTTLMALNCINVVTKKMALKKTRTLLPLFWLQLYESHQALPRLPLHYYIRNTVVPGKILVPERENSLFWSFEL